MAGEITQSTTSSDQEKYLGARLIQRSYIKLVAGPLCEKLDMTPGMGLTANFVRYKRMNVPLTTISEGTDPANSSFSLSTVSVTLDQWGDVITITDVAQLTTKHPLVQQCTDLLADNAARVMDREIQLVWIAGTNIQYGDGSITARGSITSTMKMTDTTIHKARVTHVLNGVPPRGGPALADAKQVAPEGSYLGGQNYVGICGPEVLADIMATGTSLGTFVSVAMYNNAKQLYAAEIGTWLGIRWVETNFIPRFKLFGNSTTAVASGAAFGTGTPTLTVLTTGGTLRGTTGGGVTFFWKVTRKDLLRGFEEDISIAHSTATTAATDTNSYSYAMPATAGFVYNVYFDTVVGGGTGTDATLGLSVTNAAASATSVVTANPAATTNPPASTPTAASATTVYPVFIFGAEACNWVGFYGIQVMITKDESIIGNILRLKRAIGYKFFGKAMIRDQDRLLRVEVVATIQS
jgi:N4-gp56 family major capsid protein